MALGIPGIPSSAVCYGVWLPETWLISGVTATARSWCVCSSVANVSGGRGWEDLSRTTVTCHGLQSLKNAWDTVPHCRAAAGHTWDSSAVWAPCLPGCGMSGRAESTKGREGKKERKGRLGAKGNHITGGSSSSHDITSSPQNWGPLDPLPNLSYLEV